MKERMIDIVAPDGKMETFVTHPEDGAVRRSGRLHGYPGGA